MKDGKGCDFTVPKATHFKVTKANYIRSALFLACDKQRERKREQQTLSLMAEAVGPIW